MHLLEAPEPHDAEPVNEVALLQERVRELEEDLADLRKSYARDRQQLSSLLNGVRSVFNGASTAPSVDGAIPTGDKWEKIKAKLGGKLAEVIDALLTSQPATRTQLKHITGGRMSTIDQAIYKLRDMGLIVKSGDGWSLKP